MWKFYSEWSIVEQRVQFIKPTHGKMVNKPQDEINNFNSKLKIYKKGLNSCCKQKTSLTNSLCFFLQETYGGIIHLYRSRFIKYCHTEHTVKSLLFVGYQFSWVGWSTKLRIQRTMKLGKQFDINILANTVLEWPQLSGPAALGTIDYFNDEISTSIPFNGL